MVIVKKIKADKYLIDIKPNGSLNGIARIIFILSISFICIGIATIFFLLGATLILPFAGLEILILVTAFYMNFNWSKQRQKIPHSRDTHHMGHSMPEDIKINTVFHVFKPNVAQD